MDAPELPHELVFVDLETTGGNAAYHRITEVGVVRMRGSEVVEQWSSLINPECPIPPHIAAFTGITDAMVADAPRFADLACLVRQKIEGPVFAAHNARFDYSFLRSEFRRLGVDFSARVMCTVKLSRRLYPEFARHNLDSVIERHRLTCSARHRALGDAQVLGAFWHKLQLEIPAERLAAAAARVMGTKALPAHFPPGLADELPEGAGVFRFYGGDDELLYVGRSHSLRSSILGHFDRDRAQRKIALSTRRLDWRETAGPLGAQLLEAQWIANDRPVFNKRPKSVMDCVTIRLTPYVGCAPVLASQSSTPAPEIRFVAMSDVEVASGELSGCFGLFNCEKEARRALKDIARAHALCAKVLGLEEEGAGSCVGHSLQQCRGACVDKESLLAHRTRLYSALAASKLKRWPFPGRVAIKEGRDEYHVFDQWSYLGTAHCEDELADLAEAAAPTFDPAVYRILLRYLDAHPSFEWHALKRMYRPSDACAG